MKRIICALIAGILVPLLCACGQAGKSETEAGYMSITAEEARERMDEEADCIILDVRTEEEVVAPVAQGINVCHCAGGTHGQAPGVVVILRR